MQERNYGLDLCRILSMAMIVALHVLGQGGVLESYHPREAGFWIVYFMETCAMCSVNLFAVLSGYLSVNKWGVEKYSSYRIIELISIVMLYCLLLLLLFCIFAPETIKGVKGFLCALCPPLTGQYWYIVCYIPLAILQPYINKGLQALSLSQHRNLCVICFILFSCLPTFLHTDFFRFEMGYSFVWLAVCYVIGAYLKRSGAAVKKRNALIGYFVCAGLILGCRLLILILLHRNTGFMMNYTSPLELLMAIALLLLCRDIAIQGKRLKSLLKTLSGFSFDVYILHSYILVYDYLIAENFPLFGSILLSK